MFAGEETGMKLADVCYKADLVVANNAFEHVPDVDFSRGLRALRQTPATSASRIPHLLKLIDDPDNATIYHEHYSYLTVLTTQRVQALAGAPGRDRHHALERP
jgi:hypothetical protein